MDNENLNSNLSNDNNKDENQEASQVEAIRDDIIKRDEEPMENKEPVVEETKNRVKRILSKIFSRK
jgi:hypothetical protein